MTKDEAHIQVSAEELAHTFDESEHAPVDLSQYAFEDWLALALFWIMALAVFLQFFTRYVLNDSFAWTEEIATNLNVALVFIGSAMCVRMSRHIHVDFLYRYLPSRAARVLSTAVDLTRVAFFGYGSILIWRFMSIVDDEQMTTIALPKNLTYAFVFLGFILMFFRSLQVAAANWRRGYSVLERPEEFDAPLVAET
ncbi:TRAP transporter small permease [Microvirga rosea]|uniref:TRAP transporter small permease n=1 Tax=Microvirga rosea TaxID=2715425 RepID=UPI001D09E907|nr:TRAP transporter small permease [Microvirga rosea]MCB8821819.1 TRAP transporter small permease [Microvirga rosea]